MPFEPTPVETPLRVLLRQLSAYLRTLPDALWYYRRINMTDYDRRLLGRPMCGTVGCALGHAEASFGLESRWTIADGLPETVFLSFFYNGERLEDNSPMGVPYPAGWDATQHDVANRIDHWLATGEIK